MRFITPTSFLNATESGDMQKSILNNSFKVNCFKACPNICKLGGSNFSSVIQGSERFPLGLLNSLRTFQFEDVNNI